MFDFSVLSLATGTVDLALQVPHLTLAFLQNVNPADVGSLTTSINNLFNYIYNQLRIPLSGIALLIGIIWFFVDRRTGTGVLVGSVVFILLFALAPGLVRLFQQFTGGTTNVNANILNNAP